MVTLSWALAGAIAAFSATLVYPTRGVQDFDSLGPSLLLLGLAGAVIGRLTSLPIAFFSSMVIGIVENIVRSRSASDGTAELVVGTIIIVALLRQKELSRRQQPGGEWGKVKGAAMPSAYERVWLIRNLGRVAMLAVVGYLAYLAFAVSNGVAAVLTTLVGTTLVGLSVFVVTGLAGQLSLGQFAFAGIGAAVSVQVVNATGHFDLGLWAAAIVGALAAALVGVPALRLRGLALAVSTLAFALITGSWLLRQEWMLGTGVTPAKPIIGSLVFSTAKGYFLFSVGVLALGFWLTSNLRRGAFGRLATALRDNEDAARAFAVPSRLRKLQVYAAAGALAGLGGAVIGHGQSTLTSNQFLAQASIDVVAAERRRWPVHGDRPVPRRDLPADDPRPAAAEQPGRPDDHRRGGHHRLAGAHRGPAGRFRRRRRVVPQPDRRRDRAPAGDQPGRGPAGRRGGRGRGRDELDRPDLAGRRDGRGRAGSSAGPPAEQIPAAHTPAAGLELIEHRRPEPVLVPASSEVLLSARGIARSFGGVKAVRGVDLDVYTGEILGIIGPNGAGKTTFFEIVAGFTKADEGSVAFMGRDITSLSPEARARLGLVRSFQSSALFPTMTVRETVMVACEREQPSRVAASLVGWPRAERAKRARADDLLDVMGLGAISRRAVGELSTGTRRMVELTCMLALEPEAAAARRAGRRPRAVRGRQAGRAGHGDPPRPQRHRRGGRARPAAAVPDGRADGRHGARPGHRGRHAAGGAQPPRGRALLPRRRGRRRRALRGLPRRRRSRRPRLTPQTQRLRRGSHVRTCECARFRGGWPVDSRRPVGALRGRVGRSGDRHVQLAARRRVRVA